MEAEGKEKAREEAAARRTLEERPRKESEAGKKVSGRRPLVKTTDQLSGQLVMFK
jgi:hypothetical protein